MTLTEAKKYLARALKSGYVRYHSGIASMEHQNSYYKKGVQHTKVRYTYGINIDGDGHDGRYFGCPQIIWDAEQAEDKFPAKRYTMEA